MRREDIRNTWGRWEMKLVSTYYIRIAVSTACLTLLTTSCSTAKYSSGSSETISNPQSGTLVLRTQSQDEIDQLLTRYKSGDTNEMPRGLQALLRQMTTSITLTTNNPGTQRSPGATFRNGAGLRSHIEQTDIASSQTASTNDNEVLQDVSNDYIFGRRKPQLPLSGGYLNNPASKTATLRSDKEKSSSEKSDSSETSRARLSRNEFPSESPSAMDRSIKKAKKVTNELLGTANEALSTASDALDKGISALKQQILPEDTSQSATDSTTTTVPAIDAPAPSQEIQAALDKKAKEDAATLEPQTAEPTVVDAQHADVSEDLSTAKNAFLSRFDRSSYSVIHEGILIIALVFGFFIVTWIRMEYEQANKHQ